MADLKVPVEIETRGRQFSVGDEPVTSILKGGDIPINDSGKEWDEDEKVLAALGYGTKRMNLQSRAER